MSEKKTRQEVLDGMDAAAELAKKEFEDMCGHLSEVDGPTLESIRGWMRRYRSTAGYKRLGKILLGES